MWKRACLSGSIVAVPTSRSRWHLPDMDIPVVSLSIVRTLAAPTGSAVFSHGGVRAWLDPLRRPR